MKCRFLIDEGALSCKAGQRPYLPSEFQAREYCIKSEHCKCPFYIDGMSHEHKKKLIDVLTGEPGGGKNG